MSAKSLPSLTFFTASALAIAAAVFVPLNLLKRFRKVRLVDDPDAIGKRVKDEGEENEELGVGVPEYDYVVIGGGTSGCVLASRLSEDPHNKVLMLEAGGSGVALAFSRIPAAYGRFMKSEHDFQLWTVPQSGAGGRAKFWPRPKLLGGCSSVNAMMFHCGAPDDYDEWAAIMKGQDGAEEWKYSNFKRYFLKFEKFSSHPRFPNVDVSVRGAEGPMQIGYFGRLSNVVGKFIVACQRIGIELSNDFNTPLGTLGISKYALEFLPISHNPSSLSVTYIDSRGQRSSTESAYLTPHVLKRSNLKVATHATVTRIIFDLSSGQKRAVGVEFARMQHGPRFRVRARKEIVLSAGAVHTPHILMLSGVGPASHLSAYGVPVVHNLPGVGQNLTDHLVVNARFRARPGEAPSYLGDKSLLGSLRRVAAVTQWLLFGSGLLSSNLGEAAGFIRVGDPTLFPPDQFPNKLEDVTSGPGAPDLEIYASPIGYIDHGFGEVPKGDLITMSALLLRPQSKGSIALRSANPFDQPIIDPRYFESANDVEVLIRGMRLLLRIAKTEPLASLLIKDMDPRLDHGLDKLDNEALERVVRERGETPYHPTSSARMAPLAQGGVVDAQLRVYGIRNLRIADASVFPTIISGHTAAPCIAIAERCAAGITKANKT